MPLKGGRKWMLAFILAYASVGLFAAGFILGGSLRDLLYFIGLGLIICLVIWFLLDRAEQRLESLIVLFRRSGVSDLKLLSAASLPEDLEDYLRRSSDLHVALSLSTPSQRAMPLLETIRTVSRARVRILLPNPDGAHFEEPIEDRGLLKQVIKRFTELPEEHITVAVTDQVPNNSLIITDEWLFLFTEPHVCSPRPASLLVRAPASSELGYAYREMFEVLWGRASNETPRG